MPLGSLSYEETLDTLTEFLEVAIYTILRHGHMYPENLFERRCKYGIPIYVSRHPDLTGYVRDFLLAMRPSLQQGLVERISLDIRTNRLVDRFTFGIHSLLPLSALANNSSLEHESLQGGPSALELEVRYRACLAALYRSFRVGMDGSLNSQEEMSDRTWSLVMHLRQAMLPLTDGSDLLPWIPDEGVEDQGDDEMSSRSAMSKGKGKEVSEGAGYMNPMATSLSPLHALHIGWIKCEVTRERPHHG
ncbi:DNA-binding protein [Piptocephalis cylindrospora]|uniref:DNA-binding protein n=1 Tax=Piptocephalis cylindrospora TaxID=1907219 RepID=A0A4P9Y659_9FUNG|nr:DNA-binding protein [Piptocephalis cylindrospora]|eukprot:RKP14443.1 DNA-binding protein [Piptocephalis cylindrospora]